MFLTYVALLHKAAAENAGYGVMFPDFPGSVFSGKTIDEALKSASEGLIFHMEGMLDNGEKLPEPTSLETIIANPDYRAAFPCLVRVIPPTGHLKRVNVSFDAGLLAEIDHTARISGKNRSEFLAAAARQALA